MDCGFHPLHSGVLRALAGFLLLCHSLEALRQSAGMISELTSFLALLGGVTDLHCLMSSDWKTIACVFLPDLFVVSNHSENSVSVPHLGQR